MLIERVRRALARDYEILGEIAGGGMGLVFAARQLRLNRKVAVKILRPELATAVGVERFLSEGRLLARLEHPNIVPVYDAGEADGLLYYVMQFVEGETLADRLERGPLPAGEAERLAADLLAGLTAAHQLGIVHRDVKPANVFLRNGSALLGDFGIARASEGEGAGHTTPGELIGTLRYMAPEQRDGRPATPRSDVYAVGLVLWEACAESPWPAYQEPGQADWRRLSPSLASGVRRALELDPERRWNDAQEFHAAIGRPARRRTRLAALALLIVGLAVAGYALLRPPGPPPTRALLTLVIPPFDVSGVGLPPALGDSAADHLRSLFSGFPDFSVSPARGETRDPRTIELAGALSFSGGRLRMTVRESGGAPHGGERIVATDSGAVEQWRDLAESVADALVLPIWIRAAGDQSLHVNVIPADASDRAQLVKAEQFFSRGQWEEADEAYKAVRGTCLLCFHRTRDIARWVGLPREPAMDLVLLRGESSFPAHYRPLIHAISTPMPARLDTLELASNTWRGFFLAWFEWTDELFHRGPLYGRLRAEAIGPLVQTLLLRPHFGPALEHLAWMRITEGDQAGARKALDTLQRYSSGSGLSQALASLRELGYRWRFDTPDKRQFSEWLLQQPEVRQHPEASAGARLLMTMDAPLGAFELGGMFTRWSESALDAAVPGLLAQLFASAALGWLDSLPVIRGRLSRVTADPEYGLLGLELEAVLRAFDPDSAVRYGGETAEELTRLAGRLSDVALRARANWALGVLAAERQDSAALAASRNALRGLGADSALGRILDAAALAPASPARALALLNGFPALDVRPRRADPLEPAVVQLLRATMQQRLDSTPAALRTLRWHEHTHLLGHLTGAPQAGELDWALGTLARWKRRELLAEQRVTDAEWCVINAALARHWATGDSVYRARAAQAGEARTQPVCR